MKRLTLIAGLTIALSACGGNKGGTAGAPAASNAPLETDEQKTLYALGQSMGRNLNGVFNLSPTDAQYVMRGFNDVVNGSKAEVSLDEYGPKINQLAQSRMKVKADAEKEKGKAALDAAAKEPGAEKTASGLIFKVITPGTGPQPTANDTVKVNYEGKLTDGTVFDSSYKRGQPATFPLRGVIPCWTEGVAKMHVGEKAQLTCPSEIAYGDRGEPRGGIPGGATLIFTVELLEIMPQTPGAMPGMPNMQLKVGGTTGSAPGQANKPAPAPKK